MAEEKKNDLRLLRAEGIRGVSKNFLVNESQMKTDAPALVLDFWLDSLRGYAKDMVGCTDVLEKWVTELDLRESGDTISDRELILCWLAEELTNHSMNYDCPIEMEEDVTVYVCTVSDKRKPS